MTRPTSNNAFQPGRRTLLRSVPAASLLLGGVQPALAAEGIVSAALPHEDGIRLALSGT